MCKTLFELAWKAIHQVVVAYDKDCKKIKTFGSGFFYKYKNQLFFITADHVVHPNEHDEQLRSGEESYLWVFNNKHHSSELAERITPIPQIYSFDKVDIFDPTSVEIPDMQDVAVAVIENDFKETILTHELKKQEEIIVKGGEPKIGLCEELSAPLLKTDYCIVESCTHWNIGGGIRIERENAIYQDLQLCDSDKDGNFILKYPNKINANYWVGLSGSPVFKDTGHVIGMIIKVYEHNDTMKVIPINQIHKLLDYIIQLEQSKSSTNETDETPNN